MRIKRFEPGTELRIYWQDIVQRADWQTDIKDCKSATVKTLAMYLRTKKRDLIVCHSLTEDNEYDTLAIPWGCISRIEEIDSGGGSKSKD